MYRLLLILKFQITERKFLNFKTENKFFWKINFKRTKFLSIFTPAITIVIINGKIKFFK